MPVDVFTTVGTGPTLPATVVPQFREGTGAPLAVTWKGVKKGSWSKPGVVQLYGRATDLLGNEQKVYGTVTVDTLTSTLPARAKTEVGGTPVLPTTVQAVGSLGRPTSVPVTWSPAPTGAYASTGVVTLQGTADAGDGRTLPASVRVQVTAPVPADATYVQGVTATATFTEGGYSPAALLNGNLTDKAWSTWKPSGRNASDTVTVTLPAAKRVSHVVTHFYRDGSGSWPTQVQVQVRGAGGTWSDAGAAQSLPDDTASGPVVDVAFPAVLTDAVRVVMTARANGYITASEVRVLADAPGTSSDASAASLTVGGSALAGFRADVLDYTVAGRCAPWPRWPATRTRRCRWRRPAGPRR